MRDYIDFRIEMSGLDDHRFMVNATCLLGETRGITAVEYDPRLVDRMVRMLETPAVNPQELLEMAGVLGELLLPGEAMDLFLAAFPKHPDVEGIRLRLVIRDSHLSAVPWEYTYIPLSGEEGPLSPYLALHPAVSIIRHEAQPVPHPSLLLSSNDLFRIVAASALTLPGLPALSNSEATVIARAINETQAEGNEDLRFGLTLLDDPVTVRSLEAALKRSFELFQFSGHSGSKELLDGTIVSGLEVAAENEGTELLTLQQLARMLLSASIRVAFLNVCSPPAATGVDRLSLASQLIGEGVPAAITMQFPIEDSHAVAFSKGLYSALAAGLSLDEAVSLGRRRMHELGILINWGSPVAFSRSSDGRLFRPRVHEALTDSRHGAKTARLMAYQAGRVEPPTGPVEPGIQAAVERFCRNWRSPEVRDERTEISEMSIVAADANELNGRVSDLLRLLGSVYPGTVTEEILCRQLGIKEHRAVSRLLRMTNQQLSARQRGRLSQFSVETTGKSSGGTRNIEYRLMRRPVADLLERSPDSHSGVDYQLRLAFSFYDAGRYGDAVAHMASMFDSLVDRPGMLTVPELALFFYYLSKSLLKLNWYDELQSVLDGPYGKLSQSLLKDLEVERLQVAGMRLRQVGDLTSAQTCFDGAVNMLLEMLGSSDEPVILRSLGDSYVLQAQCRLHQAVSNSQPRLVREASLRTAKEGLGKAKSCFDRHRETTGAGIHYEGRLHGAEAFLGIANSLVQPDALTLDHWSEIERLARGAFEPERERKPFGIVAGKFAFAIVLLAKARWYSIAQSGRRDDAARSALEQADMMLRSISIDYLEPGYVQLGARYEMPKVQVAYGIVENLRALTRLGPEEWDKVVSQETIWSPLA